MTVFQHTYGTKYPAIFEQLEFIIYRLTPAYAFLILCVTGFIGKVGDGPRWPEAYDKMHNSCKEYWWTNVLYVNNLYPSALLDEVSKNNAMF